LGFQQMRVGEQEADSTLANALSMCRMFGLDRDEAIEAVQVVARTVDRWQQHFMECGVTRHDIELCAEQIDRPFLADQRREFAANRRPG
jgi:serine/threonine-protein kinase HipA